MPQRNAFDGRFCGDVETYAKSVTLGELAGRFKVKLDLLVKSLTS